MKRSNIHLCILFSVLAIVFTIVLITDRKERSIVGFGNNFIKVLSIDNPDLKKENVIIDPDIRMLQKDDTKKHVLDPTYLYYATDKIDHYAPAYTYSSGDKTLNIGKVKDLKKGETCRLYLRIDGIHKIILNGTEIWQAPYITGNSPDAEER